MPSIYLNYFRGDICTILFLNFLLSEKLRDISPTCLGSKHVKKSDFNHLNVKQLKEELRRHGLSTVGLKEGRANCFILNRHSIIIVTHFSAQSFTFGSRLV